MRRQDFGALERAWEDARLRDYYAREKRDADFRDSYLLVIYEGDQPVVETRSIEQTRSGRWEVTDDYLNESDNAMPWREVNRLLKEHDPKPDKGRRLVIELPAPNPMLKPKISREGKAWRWEVGSGKRRLAGGYGRTKTAAENDARVWLQEQARKNPVGSDAILMFRGSLLALADDSDEENRLRAEGWDEAGDIPARKLARLRQLDKNGWAELTDRPFTEKELGDALRSVERQNPATARTAAIRVGETVMGIMGVDGGYVGVVRKIGRDARGIRIVTFVGDDGVVRETPEFNVTRNVPAVGKFPRKDMIVAAKETSYDRLPV